MTHNPNKQFVVADNISSKEDLVALVNSIDIKVEKFDKLEYNTLKKLPTYKEKDQSWSIVSSVSKDFKALSKQKISYTAPFFFSALNEEWGLSNLFYVKLKNADDISLLEDLAKRHDIEIIGNNKFMPLWYTLSCSSKSSGNALESANLFFETGLFEASEPDLMGGDEADCVNDIYFSLQWALNKIQVCQAWQFSSGCEEIIVAVIDQGIELNHPDLIANLHPVSYDTESGTSPSQIFSPHGTEVAGIIGARSNNSLGVAGVAPNN